MKRLRVCHVIHNTHYGGAETMLVQVLRGLADRPVDSTVLSLMDCGPTGERIRELGVPIHAVGCVENGRPHPLRFLSLMRRIREFEPDVVQTWTYHADLVGGLAAKLVTKAPIFWNVRHATLDRQLDSRNVRISARMCGRLSNWVPTRIFLNSRAAVPVHVAVGYNAAKMEIVPNGFDTHRFQPLPHVGRELRAELGIDADTMLIGMAGRFHGNKGQSDFLKAAKRIRAQHPRTHFVLVGKACDAANETLMDWIDAQQLRSHVSLLGGRDDMPRVLNALDVYVLPSLTEGFPNIVGEAMACGIPCVVTNVGDAKRLVGESGAVVSPNRPTAMATAVLKMLAKSPEERGRLGALGRRRIIEKYNIAKIAPRYLACWQSVVDSSTVDRLAPRPSAGSSATSAVTLPLHRRVDQGHGTTIPRPKLVHVTTVPMTQWFFLRGQNEFMHRRGFDVHSISSTTRYTQRLRERDSMITIHEVPISRKIEPWKDLKSVLRLWRCFRELRPEIVQLSTPKAALLGAIAAWAARVPVRIYQIRGLSSESETGLKRKVFQQFEWLTSRLCTGCLVNAKSLQEYARRARILRAEQGFVAGNGMSNGVDLDRFDPDRVQPADLSQWDPDWSVDDGPVIGFVGRLTCDKGVEELYTAWSKLRDEFPRARLLLVGPLEAENAVSRECRQGLHSDPRVLLVGMQHDVAPFYRAMDLFVFGSHGTEGFPNAPMEAAAMGLPVIATRVVGCVDAIVHDVTGKIISPRSAEEMEAAIRAYLTSDILRQQHGDAGRARIRSGFAPADLWCSFEAFYHQQLVSAGLPVPTTVEALPEAA